jgi:hypothetical protein
MGGAPSELLYDRMKTAVIGESAEGVVAYNPSLVGLLNHYGAVPRACRPYRAQTKGKVERPYRYIRQDFFLGARFANLDDLNAQLTRWLDTVANTRKHGTTERVVAEHLAEERVSLLALPVGAFNDTLKLERRISHEGMVSVGGNRYSVPDGTRSRTVEVHMLAREIRIFEDAALIAVHPVLTGRRQCSVLPGHRKLVRSAPRRQDSTKGRPLTRAGEAVARRPLSFYDAVGKRLAGSGRRT